MVKVHYFAAARQAAGVSEETVETQAATLGELIAELAAAHDGTTAAGMHLEEVLGRCTFLADGAAAGLEHPLADVARVDVLPPFAGG